QQSQGEYRTEQNTAATAYLHLRVSVSPFITGPAGPIREEGDTMRRLVDGSLQQIGILDTYFINLCK
ncbi:MAG: hypothetical protein VXX24_09405, partial [Pseudomonadota bacterium]|nr:hypothetical protein [Pseudomonadota bacterium]